MNRSAAFLLFTATVGIRLLVHFLTGYTVDDAFITFRYAENLAAGNGFVYNLGEKVLGTTTPQNRNPTATDKHRRNKKCPLFT
jgi:hypothetical protein